MSNIRKGEMLSPYGRYNSLISLICRIMGYPAALFRKGISLAFLRFMHVCIAICRADYVMYISRKEIK